MPEMTKKGFAVRLLFWLTPWPISRALPRALRIYYFGPSGGPPPGWYDYFGIPSWFWEDVPPWDEFIEDPPEDPPPWWPPDAPPYDEFIEDLPVDPPPWWPIDPYDPPPPDQFPDLPDGPSPDPWPPSPGPGPGPDHVPPSPGYWASHHDDSHWQQEYWHFTWDGSAWVKQGGLGAGAAGIRVKSGSTWFLDYRPFIVRINYSGPTCEFWITGTSGYILGSTVAGVTLPSGRPVYLNNYDYDIFRLTISDPTSDVRITNIRFYA